MIARLVYSRHRQRRIAQHGNRAKRRAQAGLGVLLCISTFALGGCVNSGTPVSPHHYALDTTIPAAADNSKPANRHSDEVLRIDRISVPQWLASTAMVYRLAYRDNNRLASYAYSDWAAPPASLLGTVIRNNFAASGWWQAVVGPGSPAVVDAILQLRLENFSQVFVQPNQSVGIIEATATLTNSHSEQIIAQRHFRIRVAAPTPDAQGGVSALGKASRQLAVELQHWAQASSNTGK